MDKIYKRRGGNSTLNDPYLNQTDYNDPNICPGCGAVYRNKHWEFDKELTHDIKLKGDYGVKKCPACRKIEDNYPMGLVFISGNFILEHKNTLLNTIKSEERRAMGKNPLERIIAIEKEDEDRYLVKTTTDTLAHRIGNILHKSFKGNLDYKFTDDKVLRAFWSREE